MRKDYQEYQEQEEEVVYDRHGRPRKKRRRRYIPVTTAKLKVFGCVTMLCYSIGVAVIQNGIIHMDNYTTAEFSELLSSDSHMMTVAGWAAAFQMIGGLAVPIFAFLLVEGFRRTSSYKNYFLTMLAFAVLSEVPYDLAMSDSFWDTSSQNALFSMVVCLAMLYGLRMMGERQGFQYRLMQILLVIAGVLWCELLNLAFGLCEVLLVAVYYLLYDKRGVKVLLGCAISIMYVTAPFSGYLIWAYGGQQGWHENKYVFYLFYPVHLLVLGIIVHFFL
ncbi:MAG: conjugal transfer protein TraX [Clostridiales bacterium]|nr:conjugal transfer protein TraX [Clostridiales bacterium]